MNRFFFWWRYLRGHAPWDTGIAPPEVVALADQLPPGRALDLGCGTGASSLYLASRGWSVTGVDFIPQAIRRARQKAQAAGLVVDFHVADVTKLDFLTGSFDLAVDVGCLHTLTPDQQRQYSDQLARLMRPGAIYTVYAFYPRQFGSRFIGLTPEDLQQRFVPAFTVVSVVQGKGAGPQSAWYQLRRENS